MIKLGYKLVIDSLLKVKSTSKAKVSKGFFKTGKGQYGEGDVFIGVSVPLCRKVALKFKDLSLYEVKKLISYKYHEVRQTGFFILVYQFQKGDSVSRKRIYNFYITSLKYCNNWDLVDLSCYKIVGDFLLHKDKTMLYRLAKDSSLWKRRVAIVSTYAFIKKNMYDDTLRLAEVLLHDKEDLIHKAVGWMLREVGKKDTQVLKSFLDIHKIYLPRTTLRYAIERFSLKERAHYIQK